MEAPVKMREREQRGYPGGMPITSHDIAQAVVMLDLRKQSISTASSDECKLTVCARCGVEFTQRKREGHKYCPDCSALRAIEVQQQLRDHQGPVWEQTVRRQLAYWQGEADRLAALHARQ